MKEVGGQDVGELHRVGGDGCVFEEVATFPEQFLGNGKLAIVLCPAVTGHGDKPSVLIADVESDGTTLVLAEGGTAFPNGFNGGGND